MNNKVNTYKKLLGSKYNQLPASLRRFREASENSGQGIFEVEYGKGRLKHFIAWLMDLPNEGQNLPLQLQTKTIDGKTYWHRYFPDKLMSTVSLEKDMLLLEQNGGIAYGFKLDLEGNHLRYHFKYQKVFGIKLPSFLAIKIDVNDELFEDGWNVNVRFFNDIIGFIAAYRGTFKPSL
ncbi:MAG: DUF4166 domain-containing protein [Bacteroidetes bacterium]|nr:DUF4166 domain-containing protein [Bacteroidota bacterium]